MAIEFGPKPALGPPLASAPAVAPPPATAVILAQVRGEVAQAIRSAAAQEKDSRVIARLYEVASLIVGDIAARESQERVQTAPTPLRRFGGDKPGTAA